METSREMAPVVGHIKSNYLRTTETFIYAYLAHARRFQPVVLTDIARNLDAFPIACSYLIKASEVRAIRNKNSRLYRCLLGAFLQELDFPNCFEDFIRQHNIGILHAHFGTDGYRALRLKYRLGIPLLTSFYGFDASRWVKNAGQKSAIKRLFKTGDLFLTLGKNMADRLVKSGCPARKIRIQKLGIDPDQIPARQRPDFESGDKIVLLYCGRLVEKKGILYGLEAFASLINKWPNLEFQIIGTGPLRSEVVQAIRRLDLRDRVLMFGRLSHDEVYQKMRRAHLFILPSLTAQDGDKEGTPTVLLEAQATRLPVVSTRHADIPEVVLDGKTGFLVPERDSPALAERLNYLLKHPDTCWNFGKAGRCHIQKNYNIHHQVPRLESIYADLLGS